MASSHESVSLNHTQPPLLYNLIPFRQPTDPNSVRLFNISKFDLNTISLLKKALFLSNQPPQPSLYGDIPNPHSLEKHRQIQTKVESFHHPHHCWNMCSRNPIRDGPFVGSSPVNLIEVKPKGRSFIRKLGSTTSYSPSVSWFSSSSFDRPSFLSSCSLILLVWGSWPSYSGGFHDVGIWDE